MRSALRFLLATVLLVLLSPPARGGDPSDLLKRLTVKRGVCVVLGVDNPAQLIALAKSNELVFFVQSSNADQVAAARRAADLKGLLGSRFYIEQGSPKRIGVASNLADGVLINDSAKANAVESEILRVLHPHGQAIWSDRSRTKPRPAGADDWGHPYHGPDNNPQSTDRAAKAPYLTQFLCEPWYVPMPQVTVASGGRVFKAFGHIALKEREWPWLNSLVCVNGFNGALLWKKPLAPGFMIHRSTIVATPNKLYVADNDSCRVLSAATGEQRDEIIIAKDVSAGGSWKWMALADGVLYALVGPKEAADDVIRGGRTAPGWPWSQLGKGYAGAYRWGFGKTLVAINPENHKILWTHRSDEQLDSRATCLHGDRLYVYSDRKHLACLEASTGKVLWKTTDERTLKAIGETGKAQNARLGFASTAFMKANDKGLYFAGPQRKSLVAVSANNGSLMWDYPHGNFQLVLRDDGLYAMGRTETSKRFDYQSGEILEDLKCFRGNCTRATGAIDSIFTRGYRHTGTMRLDLTGKTARRFPQMRPACQDGVVVSDGMSYWGPWMCDCNHSLVGMICLAAAGDFDFEQKAVERERLVTLKKSAVDTKTDELDWTGYRGGPRRFGNTSVAAPREGVKQRWQWRPPAEVEPTAPVAAGGKVFWSGADGAVRAFDVESGKQVWTAYTGGGVRFAPAVVDGRVFVGSGDGCVHAFDAGSGEKLWRFQAAPARRRILVHGKLLSTWPVGSGVLVHDGVVYAAAGIASYDGTHVYALDAATGSIKWQNNTSGNLVGQGRVSGVSVQGHLLLHEDKLYLAGGNLVSPAIYDLNSGQCLNRIQNEWMVGPRDQGFPANPSKTMFRRSPRGRELFVVDGKVKVFDELLYSPPRQGDSRYFGGHYLQAERDQVIIRATYNRLVRLAPGQMTDDERPVGLWQSDVIKDPSALALCSNFLLAAGEAKAEGDRPQYRLWAIHPRNGKIQWTLPLPGPVASWGLCVDRRGRAIVTLQDGRVICAGG